MGPPGMARRSGLPGGGGINSPWRCCWRRTPSVERRCSGSQSATLDAGSEDKGAFQEVALMHRNGRQVGRVVGLWRYPVKSMGAEALAEVDVSWHGLAGDRRW